MYRPHRHHRRSHRRQRAAGMWGALRARLFGPGELRLALLSLLAEAPRHGYDLMKELEARSGGTYRASAGSVYPTLQQLEDEGLARSDAADGKRVYQLTPEGRAEAEAEAEAIRRIWRRAEELGDWRHASLPESWEIARPAMELAKAALRAVARAEGDPETIDEVRHVLERARREIANL